MAPVEDSKIPILTDIKVTCPEPGCGRQLTLQTIPGKPGRLEAWCNHGLKNRAPRPVLEVDHPDTPPAAERPAGPTPFTDDPEVAAALLEAASKPAAASPAKKEK